MPIVVVKNKQALSILALTEIVFRHIYEDNLSSDELHSMQDSIINWANKLKLDQEMQRVDDDEAYAIEMLGKYLKDNEDGKLEQRKKLYKDTNVDWRKVHNLPGARTEQDFIIGKQLEEKSRRYHGF